ncbi:uncharacterized protein LOC116853764 [Odontomachus brunneus]|uniref:uncharacterized protein LOC116851196 n=1 Tax=Odontomachus brunneus TaxID=486640 RepID=UPI0013F29392|nr:uncharacterized protein LOC116851196 [Odontomachus brunneus]XP_032690849.1 uncharacterized protein LOC116853764 [Odontomachus brunneus]
MRTSRSLLQELLVDAICLLSTCALYDILNNAMLKRTSPNEIELVAQDMIDCVSYLNKKILNKDDEDSSPTAGLARIIIVKVGARIMIRRNIDVTLRLVNDTVGTITSITRGTNRNKVEKLKMLLL